jgi:hypothetical protein
MKFYGLRASSFGRHFDLVYPKDMYYKTWLSPGYWV